MTRVTSIPKPQEFTHDETIPRLVGQREDHCGSRLQPLAGAPGCSGHSSVHWHGLWFFGFLVAAFQSAGHQGCDQMRTRRGFLGTIVHHQLRLANFHTGVDVHPVLRPAGHQRRHLGWLAGAGRSAQGRCGLGCVLVRRHVAVGPGRLPAPVLADDSRLRHHRRHWAGSGLYLARLNPDQVVPRSPRHGHRHGHHGLWWRCHDRLAPGRRLDEVFRQPHRSGCDANLRGDGPGLLCLHDGRRFRLPRA